jgi:hypothetical protein
MNKIKYLFTVLLLFSAFVFVHDAKEPVQNRIFGILSLPEVFGSYPCEDFESKDIQLFDTPDSNRPIGRIYVATPWEFHPQGGCMGLEVAVELFLYDAKYRLTSMEFEYEQPGVVVIDRKEHWYKIKLNENAGKSYGWVFIRDHTQYFPVEILLKQSMSFLIRQNLKVYSGPETTTPVWIADESVDAFLQAEVLNSKTISGEVWLKVELKTENFCTGESTGAPDLTGWVPLHQPDGSLSAWFWSRGC